MWRAMFLVAMTACAPKASAPEAPVTRFDCRCAVRPVEDEPGAGAACALVAEADGGWRLSGQSTVGGSERTVPVAARWAAVPVPAGRVEPEPFVAYRGPLALTCDAAYCGEREADVVFIDNLMYEAHLADVGDRPWSMSLVCSPP